MTREIPGQLHLNLSSINEAPILHDNSSSSFKDFSKHQEIINTNASFDEYNEPKELVSNEENQQDEYFPTDLGKRKDLIISQYDIPENLWGKIRLNEDEFSNKDLRFGCYLGNQSLHDYLEGKSIEAELERYDIPKELHKDVVLDNHRSPTIYGLSLAEYKEKVDKENIQKVQAELPEIVETHINTTENSDFKRKKEYWWQKERD